MNRVSIFILVAGILLAACQKDPASGGGDAKGITVKLTVSPSSPRTAWESGDKVRMFTTPADGAVSYVALSTTSSGPSASFTTSSTVKTGSHYRFVFPDAKADVVASASSVFASVPAKQTAYPGSADPAACILVGQTDDLKKEVSMIPAPALLKFTLSGEGASEVKKMEITSMDGYILAGDIAWELDINSSVYPKVHHNSVRNREQPSSTITLSGTFEAGKTYYVSVVPGASTSGLTLNVSDAEGRTQTLEIAEQLRFIPGTPCDLKTVTVEEFVGVSDFAPRFVYTKEGVKPYVFVFMSDGFTESERDKYTTAAQQAIDYIFSVQPYKGLKEYFSAYICWTPSETSGVGKRWNTTYSGSGMSAMMATYGQDGRNTIYEYVGERCPEVLDKVTSLNNVGIFMLNNNTSYIRPVCDWESSGRFVTPVGLIPNTSSGYSQWCYGGTWKNYDYRDGVRHDLSQEELIALGYASNGRRNGDFREECLHEGAGHGFGRLGDEYWTEGNKAAAGYTGLDYYHNSTLPTMLNISANSSNLPWAVLNNMRDELIKKDARYARIGTYEGAYGYETGIWRAEQVSVMMDNRPYFSTWERALIYMRLMRSSGENSQFDVRNEADLKKFLEFDVANEGIKDSTRDK
ncbi:MAG: hypothetical protein J6M31_05475 [Bacteroidales bacterium]|nr:hypothetical protein [Bacteroidales bacterium]